MAAAPRPRRCLPHPERRIARRFTYTIVATLYVNSALSQNPKGAPDETLLRPRNLRPCLLDCPRMGKRRLRSRKSRLRLRRIQKSEPARHGARAGHRRQPRHDPSQRHPAIHRRQPPRGPPRRRRRPRSPIRIQRNHGLPHRRLPPRLLADVLARALHHRQKPRRPQRRA